MRRASDSGDGSWVAANGSGAGAFVQPLAMLASAAMAAVGIGVMHMTLPDLAADILLDRKAELYPLTVQNIMWIAFAVGFGELTIRLRAAFAERTELRRGYLPEDERSLLQAPDLGPLYKRTRSNEGGRRFLPCLIQRVVLQFQSSRSVDQANALLNSSLELYLHEIDLRYSMVRYIVWLIPTLGFIGTVIGISLALAYAAGADTTDPTLLSELTRRLAVAFNTTLLALVMSAFLVLIQHIVQAREERALNLAGQYCLDNLINRLYER